MGKTTYLLIGGLVGAAAGLVYTYVFGPARGTRYDGTYRSRWDWAIEEGRRAAIEQEAELRRQLELAKLPKPKESGE